MTPRLDLLPKEREKSSVPLNQLTPHTVALPQERDTTDAGLASLTPRTVALPEGEGASGGPVYGRAVGWAGVVWRGCQEREGAGREPSKALHESGQGQGERGEAWGQRRWAQQGGEQGQGGPDQAPEGFERQEQERGSGHWLSGCKAYSASVHYRRTDGKSGLARGAGALQGGCLGTVA